MNTLDCLLPLVGLSRKECNCINNDDRPTDWNESESGYYLDDIGDGLQLSITGSASDCGQGKIWYLLDRARKEGALELIDLLTLQSLSMKANGFQGYPLSFGDTHKHTAYYFPTSPVVGVEVIPNPKKGGYLKINQIGLFLNTSITITLNIFNSNNLTIPIHSIPVTTTAGSTTYVNTNYSLPTIDQHGKNIKYYFSYNLPTGVLPSNFPTFCGCGSEKRGWMEHAILYKGFSVPSMLNLYNSDANMSEAMGIVIYGEMVCEPLSFLCEMSNGSVGANIIAKTLQLLQVNKLAQFLLESTDLTRANLLSKETLINKIEINNKKAEAFLKNISTILPATSDCFGCHNHMEVKELFV